MRKRKALAVALTLFSILPLLGRDRVGELQKKVETLRGLSFTKPLTVKTVDASGMRGVLREQLAKEYPPDQWAESEAVLKVFGLIPPKMNLRAVLAGFLEEQAAGLYDPRSKVLYVAGSPIADEDLLSALGGEDFSLTDVFLVHELDHALTDQRFSLLSLPIEDRTNEDRAAAARCVVEGDATWIMYRYMYDRLQVPEADREKMGDLASTMGLGRELMGASAPAYVQENLLVGYLAGLALVKTAYGKGGIAGVNALYTHPPRSMEEVLHPAKYFSGTDPPLPVSCPAVKDGRGKDWKAISKGTWGEFNVRILLTEHGVDREAADGAAKGWGGDCYRVYRSPGGVSAFLWSTRWDTVKDAKEFESSARRVRGWRVARRGDRVAIEKGWPGAAPGPAAPIAH